MPHIFVRVVMLIALAGVAVASCSARPAPTPQPLTDAERATIGDTVRHLYRESSQMFDSDLDCEEVVDRLAPAGQPASFVAQGQLIELTNREEALQMCRAIRQSRVSAREEIMDDRVEVLGRDVVVLVTRGVYTVQFTDGRTTVRPQVVTTVWARSAGEWRRVHLHESWAVGEQPSGPQAGMAGR
jgi:hypothetical protein